MPFNKISFDKYGIINPLIPYDNKWKAKKLYFEFT